MGRAASWCIQTSSSLPVTGFAPERLAASLGGTAAGPASRRLAGAVLYADVSGSVELAERLLSRHGTGGADELSRTLNACFGAFIDIVTAAGGEVIQFAGDALTAAWIAPPGMAGDAACRAESAARSMIAALAQDPALAALGVSIRAGIGAGALVAAQVARDRESWEILVAGEAVGDAFAAAAAAGPGAVSLGTRAAALIGTGISPVPGRDEAGAASTPAAPLAFAPRPVGGRLAEGLDPWTAELRHVALLFARLDGLVLETDDDVPRLHEAALVAADIVARHAGYVRQISMDDKGIVLVAAFGVPPLARECRPDDAPRAALALRAAWLERGLDSSIGLAAGRAFCGLIGNATRRDYAVVGAPVNLAARLMAAAAGRVLGDLVTARETADHVAVKAAAPLTLKGVADPVTPFEVLASAARPSLEISTVAPGRESEIRGILQRLEALHDDEAGLFVLEAAPGMGKSTLLRAVEAAARRRGLALLSGSARWNGQSTPYHVWVDVIEMALGIKDLTDPGERLARTRAILDADPALARTGALLNDVLALGIEESRLTRGLTGVHRAEELRELIGGLLAHYRGTQPLLLLLDDMQWSDPVSWSVLFRGSRGLEGVLMVIATRPVEGIGELRDLLARPGTVHRELPPLDVATLGAASAAAAGAELLDPELVTWLNTRAGGNPFFARQIALSLIEKRLLIVDPEGRVTRSPAAAELADAAVPPSVEALVLSRVDGLDPLQQVVLKTASVIGSRFSFASLSAVHPLPERQDRLADDLQALIAAQLVTRDGSGFAFAHQIVVDAAYGTMVAAQRAQAHRRLAIWLEETHAADLGPVAEQLARHWEATGEDEPTFRYLELAAREAMHLGAFREAMVSLTRALERDRERGFPIAAERRARWHRMIGDAHEAVGNVAQSGLSMEAALAHLGHRLPDTAAGWRRLLIRALVTQLAHQVIRPRALPAGSSEHARQREIAWASTQVSEVRQQANDSTGMFAAICVAANACDRLGVDAVSGRPYSTMGVAFALTGAGGLAARYFARCRAIARQTGDTDATVRCLVAEAYVALARCDFARARALLDEAQPVAGSTGYRRGEEMVGAILANVELAQARYADHRAHALALRAQARERGRTLAEIWSGLELMADGIRTGELDVAQSACDDTHRFPDMLDQERVMRDGWELALLVRRGDWARVPLLAERVALGLGIRRAGESSVKTIVLISHWQPFWCYVETRIAMLEHTAPAERTRALADAHQACKAYRGFARRFAIGQPGMLALCGRLAALQERRDEARRLLLRALVIDGAGVMPYERARARQYLAQLEASGSEARRDGLQGARREYTALGCAGDVANVDRLLSGALA